MSFQRWQKEVCGNAFIIEHGKMARQSSGSVLVRLGESVVLVNANVAKNPKPGGDFLPLTVEFQEKFYAAGKIPGGFLKREGRPGDTAILSARLVDRPIRPLFPKGFRNEIQIIATVLSVNPDQPPDVLAIFGASLALNISTIPFSGMVAGVRVGYVDGKVVVFPTMDQLENSLVDLTIAGSRDAIVMVEGEAKEVGEDLLIEILNEAHQVIQELCQIQQEIIAQIDLPEKITFEVPSLPEEDRKRFEQMIDLGVLKEKVLEAGKKARNQALEDFRTQMIDSFFEEASEEEIQEKSGLIHECFEDILQKVMRRMVVEEKLRADGRRPDEVRPINCELSILPRTHGSALFTRGETQSLGLVTLGAGMDVQIVDTIFEDSTKRFMLHYNFPPFCTGEVKGMRGLSRREVGHGHLAERAVKFILPPEDAFPYTIRVVSEILESNGSSSMASICAASLSLMDAGVPVSKHVAGVAMGMIKEPDEAEILTDILGMEDHLGDMDFKVAGTKDGITGFQMDIKVSGITSEIMALALTRAKTARLHILSIMESTIAKAREQISPYAPMIETTDIPIESIGELIGPGGKMIRRISAEYGVDIEIEDEKGRVKIFGENSIKVLEAKAFIEKLMSPIEPGAVFEGKIVRVEKYGVFVELVPGKSGLLHVSNMGEYVKDPTESMKIDDTVTVRVAKIEDGKYELHRILYNEDGTEKPMPPKKPRESRDNRDRRGPNRSRRPESSRDRGPDSRNR